MSKYRGVPEKFKSEGIFVRGMERVIPGDRVKAIRNVEGSIETLTRGFQYRVADLIVEPNGNVRGFEKRLKLEGYKGDFNPKRFRKVETL